MDSAQWTQPQEIGVAKSMATISPSPSECTRTTVMERKVRPQNDQALNCPRCHSTNTKFCYYNNYSLTQPRYFCKSCRRYWTEGGTLRNVPVGGGSRKNKKSNSIISPSLSMATASVSSSQKLPDLNPPGFSSQNPKSHDHHAQDLNLGFQAPQDYYHGIPQFLEFPKIENRNVINSSSSSSSSSSFSTPLSAINLLRNGIAVRGLMNSSIPMAPETNAIFASGFQFQECKPSVAFSYDGFHGNSGSTYSHENNINESLVFPFGTTKRHSSMSTTEADDQSIKGHENSNSNGYNWNGMLG